MNVNGTATHERITVTRRNALGQKIILLATVKIFVRKLLGLTYSILRVNARRGTSLLHALKHSTFSSFQNSMRIHRNVCESSLHVCVGVCSLGPVCVCVHVCRNMHIELSACVYVYVPVCFCIHMCRNMHIGFLLVGLVYSTVDNSATVDYCEEYCKYRTGASECPETKCVGASSNFGGWCQFLFDHNSVDGLELYYMPNESCPGGFAPISCLQAFYHFNPQEDENNDYEVSD